MTMLTSWKLDPYTVMRLNSGRRGDDVLKEGHLTYSSHKPLTSSYSPVTKRLQAHDADARYLLQQLGCKDLNTQRQIQVALMLFKALNDPAPDYLSSMCTERSTSGYVLRDSTNKLNVPLPRNIYVKRSFSCRGTTLWNSLHCNLWQEKSLNRFKQLLNFHFS